MFCAKACPSMLLFSRLNRTIPLRYATDGSPHFLVLLSVEDKATDILLAAGLAGRSHKAHWYVPSLTPACGAGVPAYAL